MRVQPTQLPLSLVLFAALLPVSFQTIRAADAPAPTAAPAAQPSPEQNEFFEKKIPPLHASECFQCHSAEAGTKLKGNLRLDSRELSLKGGYTGPAIVPGNPGKSLALTAISYKDDN